MLDPQIAGKLRETLDINEAEMADLSPRLEGVMAMCAGAEKVRIIAEVMSSVNCLAGIRKGHKLVFNILPFMLNTEETNCPLCMRALTPIMPHCHGMWELALNGVKHTPRGQARMAGCMDPGLDWGGLGHVRFKIHLRSEK
ncbi:MAG: hypothetical protein QGH23_06165 [Dehalococcoidia bacterium]|jgi:hypothetical protein|nr:hypothetical protein [Dehalococcoidia bacterium]MDP6782940.1 hypothetical protein [Dehalococcoidia bacterium]